MFHGPTPSTNQDFVWTNDQMFMGGDEENERWEARLAGLSPNRMQTVCAVQNVNASRFEIHLNGMIGAQGPIAQIYPVTIDRLRVGMDFDEYRPFLGAVKSINIWNSKMNITF